MLDIVVFAAERVKPTEAVRECRDRNDDKYLALAAAGGANVMVSSDCVTRWRCIPGEGFPSCPRPAFSPSHKEPDMTGGFV